MLCEICQQRDAVIKISKVINGEKTERHLCAQCAKQEAVSAYKLDITSFINHFFNLNDKPAESTERTEKVCPVCNTAFSEFVQRGKLSCDACYEEFDELLEPIIKRIHGKSVHTGKRALTADNTTDEVDEIRRKLEEAVKNENYELAAEYRDIIKIIKHSEEQ